MEFFGGNFNRLIIVTSLLVGTTLVPMEVVCLLKLLIEFWVPTNVREVLVYGLSTVILQFNIIGTVILQFNIIE